MSSGGGAVDGGGRGARRYRVVQWGTGNVGGESLRGILADPRLELAGVFVYSDEKDGVDAGTLVDAAPTGVRATRDFQQILGLDADCVAYMPRNADVAEVCELLASGKNVVATPFLFYAHAMPTAERERIVAACERGNSSVHGTGIHPGFGGMVLPLVLSGMASRIDRIRIEERANWSLYNSPRITFDNMRFGAPPEQATLDANPFARFNSGLFQQQIHMLAAALDAQLDEVTEMQQLEVASDDFTIAAGRVEAGGVAGQRYLWEGVRDGRALIQIEALWTIGPDYPDGWPKPRDGWTVTLEGSPSLRTHFVSAASFERRDASIEDHVHAADIATAMQAIHSIPGLCEAAPGVRSVLDLPIAHSGVGFGGSIGAAHH